MALLLSHGADPNLGAGRLTPLMNAATWCSIDGVMMLVQAGADPALRDEHGKTAWDSTCDQPAEMRERIHGYLSNKHGI
jgi:ankyrin repeat protein